MVRIADDPLHNSISTEALYVPNSDRFLVTNNVVSDELYHSKDSFSCRATRQGNSSDYFYSNDGLNFHFGVILFDAVLVILMTRIVAFLLRPCKQPKVVSEVIGGIILGPSVLGIDKKFNGAFFSANVKYIIGNIGTMGFMYFLFIIGVKMDLSVIKFSRRKHKMITLAGVIIPLVTGTIVGNIIRPSMDKILSKPSSIGRVVLAMAVTGYAVIYPILQELNLLSSEIGQMALAIAIITDGIAIILLIISGGLKQTDVGVDAALWYMISVIAFMVFSAITLQQAMIWIIGKNSEGKLVEQVYVVLILLGALVMGFLSDMLGLGIVTGCMLTGLVIPDGPPLGSSIVARSETFIMNFFMPFSYVYIGMSVDLSAMTSVSWSGLAPLFTLAMSGIVFKLLATLVTSLLVKIPFRDALTLTLILNLRGQQEFMLIMHWMEKSVIEIPSYTMLVLLVTAVTAIATPLIRFLYDPTRPYIVNTRRAIQYTPPHEELKVVACVHNQDSVATLINLFEFSCSCRRNLSVYALCLTELNGRAAPLLIDHEKQKMTFNYSGYDSTYNALKIYIEAKRDVMEIHSFTAVVPKQTMYQDICKLAMIKEADLVILPFHMEWRDSVRMTELHHQRRTPSVLSNVLDHAPCSVGILVHKVHLLGPLFDHSFNSSPRHVLVLFLGGADARESLFYADRILMNPNVFLTVIRFLSHHHHREYEQEKKLDDGVIISFRERNGRNKRVVCREVVMKNGEETLATIQAFGNDVHFDLWILGRHKGINPVLLEGLSSDWCEHLELGVIGDYISSMDFDGTTSILVVQQQTLRG
ncbi:PREDICTED: cation/H(+) antiporter 24-like [Populus euphratica]|uniref:Cation/H(+) antiporter 24-like n=1 Tax=Populus euphratica TaxID=75702 RepID=A0AAJ6X7N7_POPEU|nr:PREDICTED: cation/H(+) antiporter 24-like [Populus euphratica]